MYLSKLNKLSGDNIPRDSTYSRTEEVTIPLWLYVLMATLAGLGILLAIGLFVFNIVHRNNRYLGHIEPFQLHKNIAFSWAVCESFLRHILLSDINHHIYPL